MHDHNSSNIYIGRKQTKGKKSKLFAFFSSLHLMKKKTSLHCIDLNKEGRCPYFPEEFCLSVFPSEKNRKEKGTLVEIYPLRRKLQVFTFLCLNKKKERNLKLEKSGYFFHDPIEWDV